jgi:hypothetical protein
MEIVRTIRARDGDTLCGIAVENGFKNCTKLRPANAPELAARQLKPGEAVKIPAVTQKKESGQTEMLHTFVRLGKVNRVFIIEDKNRPNGRQAKGDVQRQLGVSNYVPGRQGRGFASDAWRDKNFFGFSAGAGADPDHFRVLVHDLIAHGRNEDFVEVKLRTQRPKLGTVKNEIESWQDLGQPGTTLEPVRCKRWDNTPFYRSPYMRLVVDEEDRQLKRTDGRINLANDNGGTSNDTGTAVTEQVLLAPGIDDPDIEILDYRVEAFRDAPDCEHANPDGRCRARFFADVGKSEIALKLKVVRIGGQALTEATNAQLRQMVFVHLRNRYAQANIGVKLVQEPGPGVTIVENFIHDVAEPRNMIIISDFDGLSATGGKTLTAEVNLASGRVSASITTERGASPQLTASKLAAELRRQGVVCRVSANPPIIGSPRPFGSCDVLCFNPDGTMATVHDEQGDPGEAQTITSTKGWTNARVRNEDVYNTAADPNRGGKARMVGSPDYRAAAKNFNSNPGKHFCAFVTKRLETAGLNGEAILPHFGIPAPFTPVPEFRLVVFLSRGGYTSPVTLSHEGGHALCDCFHTTFSNDADQEEDHEGNIFCNNAALGFSEWMSAFARTRPIRKRISDGPLTVWLVVLKRGVPRVEGEWRLMGGRKIGNPATDLPAGQPANPTCAERLRTHSGSMFVPLRRLHPAPEAPL